LDSCDGVEEGAKVCKLYYEMKNKNMEHFKARDPELPKIKQCLAHQDYFFLPNTPSGDVVIFHRLSSSRASDYVFDEAIKTFFMTIDSCFQKNGPHDGAIFLFDMKGVGLMHLTRVNLSSIRKFFQYLQEGVPGKLRAIHVLNVVYFFDKIMALIKPFMKAEILKNVGFSFNTCTCIRYTIFYFIASPTFLEHGHGKVLHRMDPQILSSG
jgi:endoplasmic reticulum protein 29